MKKEVGFILGIVCIGWVNVTLQNVIKAVPTKSKLVVVIKLESNSSYYTKF